MYQFMWQCFLCNVIEVHQPIDMLALGTWSGAVPKSSGEIGRCDTVQPLFAYTLLYSTPLPERSVESHQFAQTKSNSLIETVTTPFRRHHEASVSSSLLNFDHQLHIVGWSFLPISVPESIKSVYHVLS